MTNSRFVALPEDIVSLTIIGTTNHLTPDQEADNEAYVAFIAKYTAATLEGHPSSMSIRPTDLFHLVGLLPGENVFWKDVVPCAGSGVYVISVADLSSVSFTKGFESERQNWQGDQEIVYIGRGKRLSRRVAQFYKHVYGDHSPHRGGQGILLLVGDKIVSWAATDDCAKAEDDLLKAFQRVVGRMPFGNRVSSAHISEMSNESSI